MTTHICSYCGNEYKNKKRWYEHEIICEIMHKKPTASTYTNSHSLIEHNNNNNNNNNDTIANPNITLETLYNVIKEVVKKQYSLEKEVALLKKHTIMKTSVLEWLGQNIKPILPLKSLLNAFTKIEITDIEYLLRCSVIEYLNYVIERNIDTYMTKHTNKYEYPIFIYENISHTYRNSSVMAFIKIYYYNFDVQQWIDDDIIGKTLWNNIQNNMIIKLNEWKKNCSDKTDNIEIEFQTTLLKIIESKKEDTHIKTIKNIVYNKLKTNINSVSYQFTV